MADVELNRREFINQYPPFNVLTPAEVPGVFSPAPLHLYVHLPFCAGKCGYCYFKSFPDTSPERIAAYLAALEAEITHYGRLPQTRARTVRSLYLGGGTPTLLSTHQLERLISVIRRSFHLAPDAELCCEGNPNDTSLDDDKLACLRELGLTRLSLGVQTFDDELLHRNGRQGSVATFERVYARVRAAGIPVVNLDIMSGLIGESWENWRAVIGRLLHLAPENIAFYKLEIYYNTRLFRELRASGAASLASDSEESDMIRYAYDRLQDEGGYQVANCFNLVSDRRHEHVHRKGIWEGEDMLGLGLTAHSCFNGSLYQNTWVFDDYLRDCRDGKLPIRRAHRLSAAEFLATAMVYGVKSLRMSRRRFVERFGFDMRALYADTLDRLARRGLLELTDDYLLVPRPYYVFADDICREFFLPQHRSMMLAHILRN